MDENTRFEAPDADTESFAEQRAASRALWLIAMVAWVSTSVVMVLSARWASVVVLGRSHGWVESLVESGAFMLVGAPITVTAVAMVNRRFASAHRAAEARRTRLDQERERRLFEVQLADAMEMAEHETEALRVVERAFATVAPTAFVELLLADNSNAQLLREAVSGLDSGLVGCKVETPQECPAARRARVHHFPDSTAINACPKLTARAGAQCAAICTPVSVMGRTVGVIHTVADRDDQLDQRTVSRLESIAEQAGARLGMLRMMAETQLQAETDGLTGLLNRRAFENAFHRLRGRSPLGSLVIAMIDLDHFKRINDTHGHETGDRALRLFAETLRSTLRASDLIARRGGEEFSLALPDCDLMAATGLVERVRTQLQVAARDAGLPAFTASFGLTAAYFSEDLNQVIARADSALFEAKRTGRDRVVSYTADDGPESTDRAGHAAAAAPDRAAPANRPGDGDGDTERCAVTAAPEPDRPLVR